MELFSKPFRLLVFLTLLMVYLVFMVGSLVRITGSGMGCPDWPKCFGSWVPPASESALPPNYQEEYLQMRMKKVEKFAKILSFIGLNESAEKLKNDPSVLKEEAFNARKTWTEYVNRLVGFVAGNLMLFQFLIFLFYYKKRKLIFLSLANLILIGLTGWLGSIVVASNLTPWTITLHMLLGVGIILLQCYILNLINIKKSIVLKPAHKWILIICFFITLYQIFLGTQVRESIDHLALQGIGRESWSESLGLPYFIHRSFSWLVLILICYLAYTNECSAKIKYIRWSFLLLIAALLSGITLGYLNMPAVVQTIHLMSAVILLGIIFMTLLKVEKRNNLLVPENFI